MKKNIFIFLFVFIFSLGFLGSINPPAFTLADTTQDTFMIRAYGDSIASGDKLSSHDDYVNGITKIADGCYPQVFSESYIAHFGGEIVSKAVSGDETWQLLDILETDSQTEVFKNTEIVTLCIGANNVLGVALSNIKTYLLGEIDDTAYRALLQAGLDQFIEDWPTILEYFSGKKVVTTTVYNPYRYAAENFPDSLKNNVLLASFVTKFETMLEISMEYLQEINDIIRASASEDVYVVDIWNLFAGFSNEEYSQYLNVDTASISITLDMISNTSLLIQEFKEKCDPHPTYAGHERIAQEHLNVFKYFKLESSDLMGIKDINETVSLSLDTFESGSYTFKVNKKVGETTNEIATSQTYPASINPSLLEGQGNVFVEVYSTSDLIYTTNSLEYDIKNNSHVLSTTNSLQGVKENSDTITFTVKSTYTDSYTYKLCKKINNVETEYSSLSVTADKLNGKGTVYVKVYKNSKHIATTNSFHFDIILNSFSLTSDSENLNAIFDDGEKITLTVQAQNNNSLSFKIYNKIAENSVLLGSEKSVTIYAVDYEGEGSFYAEVYYDSSLLSTTDELPYNISINTHTISTTDGALIGLKDVNKTITIKVNKIYSGNYTYKLYKVTDEGETLLKESTGNATINAMDLVGEGTLYMAVYKNGKKVATTNALDFQISLNQFVISTTSDITDVVLDSTDNIEIKITGQDYSGYNFKIYKNGSYLSTTTSSTISISAESLSGSGQLYIDVYKNYSKIHSTNSLDYSITINEFSMSCSEENLTGYIGGERVITFEVSAIKTEGYIYKLNKRSGGVTTVLREVSTPVINITANDINGSGSLYLEVYKGQTCVYKTTNVSYSYNAINFIISSSLNLTTLESDDQKVSVNVNTASIPTPIFMLYRLDNGVKTKLQTTSTGEFEIKASQLDGEGTLFVEVYSEGHKIAESNALQFKYDSKNHSDDKKNENIEKVLIIGAIILVAVIVVVVVVISIIGSIKKKKMWKL